MNPSSALLFQNDETFTNRPQLAEAYHQLFALRAELSDTLHADQLRPILDLAWGRAVRITSALDELSELPALTAVQENQIGRAVLMAGQLLSQCLLLPDQQESEPALRGRIELARAMVTPLLEAGKRVDESLTGRT